MGASANNFYRPGYGYGYGYSAGGGSMFGPAAYLQQQQQQHYSNPYSANYGLGDSPTSYPAVGGGGGATSAPGYSPVLNTHSTGGATDGWTVPSQYLVEPNYVQQTILRPPQIDPYSSVKGGSRISAAPGTTTTKK